MIRKSFSGLCNGSIRGSWALHLFFERSYGWNRVPNNWREETCLLLCRLSILAEKLLVESSCSSEWPENSLQEDVQTELKELFNGANEEEQHTPVLPDIVIEVWENTVPDFECSDWNSCYRIRPRRPSRRQILLHELCSSFFNGVNVQSCEEYSTCLRLDDGKFGADVLSEVISVSNSPWR